MYFQPKKGTFHCHVSLPEGTCSWIWWFRATVARSTSISLLDPLEGMTETCLIFGDFWRMVDSKLTSFQTGGSSWIFSSFFWYRSHHDQSRIEYKTISYPFDMIVPLASWMFSILHFTTVHPSYSFETQSRGKMFLKYLDLLNPAIGTMNEAPREDRARFSLNLGVWEFHWEVWSFKMNSRWWGDIYNLIHVLIMD